MINLSRRQLIKSISAGLTFGPSSTLALSGAEESAIKQTHEKVIEIIKSRTDKPSQLNILIPNGCQPNLAPVTAYFSKESGININIDVAPVDDINTTLMLAVSSQSKAYDLALPATFGLPDLVETNTIMPLDTFAEQFQPSGFQNDALYTLGDYYAGKLYGYQTDGDAYLMFFNQSWLNDKEYQKRYEDKYDAHLSIPLTWEELDRQIEFFNDPKKDRYGGTLFRTPGYLVWEWWIRFHSKGFFPLADDLIPQIDNEAGVEALEELITVSQHLCPSTKTNGLFENWEKYAKGNSYCNIGWGGTQKYLNSEKSNMKGKLAFSPTPGGRVKGKLIKTPYFNWGWNYTVTSNSKYPEIAYLFALFAVSPHISTLSVRENGYFDPFRKSHYEDKQIQDIYSKEFLEAHATSMLFSIPDFYVSGQSEYINTLRGYLLRALEGKMTAHQALQNTAKIWRKLHRRFDMERQKKQWQFLKSRYPTQLRNMLS